MGHRVLPGAQDRLASGRAVAQLAALAGVHELLTRNGIEYWLFGGWAVDFYAGTVTRPHDDVDVAVWLPDQERIAALLTREGWAHAPEPDEDGGTSYQLEDVRLELTFLVRDGDNVCIPLRAGPVPWPGAFGDERGELEGVRARLIALDALKRGKSASRDEPGDAAKDRADALVLDAL